MIYYTFSGWQISAWRYLCLNSFNVQVVFGLAVRRRRFYSDSRLSNLLGLLFLHFVPSRTRCNIFLSSPTADWSSCPAVRHKQCSQDAYLPVGRVSVDCIVYHVAPDLVSSGSGLDRGIGKVGSCAAASIYFMKNMISWFVNVFKHSKNAMFRSTSMLCSGLHPYLTLPYLQGGQVVTPAQR